MFKGYVSTDGQQYYSKGKLVDGEEKFMVSAKTRKELFAKLDKIVHEQRQAAR